MSDSTNETQLFDNFDLKLNSVGQATYYKQNIFQFVENIKRPFWQLSLFSSEEIDVISVIDQKNVVNLY